MINIVLHVLFCINSDINPFVIVSTLVLRTRADTNTSGIDIGRDTEQHM